MIESLEASLQSSSALALLIAYLGGILVSFTPCVYPVIPITVAYIGGQSGGSKARSFILSLAYVLGMAATYTGLGLAAALTGALFGNIQTSPWTYIVVANVCILLGLSMLDVFAIPLPGFAAGSGGAAGGRRGLPGAVAVGAVSGLVVGPCTAPVLAALLGYVAARQNVAYGAALLFVFAFGMGTLLILAGTFSGILAGLPKAGGWMVRVKRLFGWILIVLGQYFLVTAGTLMI